MRTPSCTFEPWKHQVVELDRRLAQLDKRKARLEEAYLYEQAIDRDTYTRHSDRLSEERALLQLGRHEAETEGLDVEKLLNYAEYLALNPARLWQDAGPEQRARLQVFLVPSGLTWDGERGLPSRPRYSALPRPSGGIVDSR